MKNRPVLQPVVLEHDGFEEQTATEGWYVRLYVFDHAHLIVYTPQWTADVHPDLRVWLDHNDPDCGIELYNATTVVLTFATTQGAFAFKMRYC